MLAVPCKRTSKLDLAKPLRGYIEREYPNGKQEAEKHAAGTFMIGSRVLLTIVPPPYIAEC